MKASKFFFAVILTAISFAATGQTVKGVVCDSASRQPISNVTVYIDGTTYNAATNDRGEFVLNRHSLPQAVLVASHVAYKLSFVNLSDDESLDTLFLAPQVENISDVVVAGDKDKVLFSEEDKFKSFFRQLIGTSAARTQCEILNREDIRLIFDSRTMTLTAYTSAPIIIRNDYLGYKIHYNLMDFTIKYSKLSLTRFNVEAIYYTGTFFFEDLGQPTGKVLRNREKSYSTSIQRFVNLLFDGQLDDSDFLMYVNGSRRRVADCFVTDSVSDNLRTVSLTDKLIEETGDSDEALNYYATDAAQIAFMDVVNGRRQSRIRFFTDEFVIAPSQIVLPLNKIIFSGDMGDQRVGDLLPLNYKQP
jgi:hypothetical protein